MRITAIRLRAPARPARPAVPGGLGPGAAHGRSRSRSSGSRPTRASSASARATRWTASRRSSTCSSARIRWPSRATSGRSRRSISTPVATGRSRPRCGTSPARSPGCRSRRCSAARPTAIPAYASCGMLLPAAARAESALRLREEGFRALKIRVDPRRLDEGLAAVAATRDAVGDTMAIMVDLNQGWRMAGDTSAVARSGRRRARSPPSSPSYDVLWVEEPLAGTDLRGLAALRASAPGVRIAGRRDDPDVRRDCWPPLDADAFDVYQPDVVLAAGMLRTRTIAELALARNRWFTPHTWTNGIGLLANLHVAAGVGGGPFLEFPYDPPGWTPERRDVMLAEPIRPGPPTAILRVPARAGPRDRRSTRPPSRGTRHDDASRAAGRDRRRLDRPRRRRRAADRAVHRRRGSCRRRPAGPSTTSPAATARRIAAVAEGGAEDVDRGRRGRPARRSTTAAGPTSRRPTASASCCGSPSSIRDEPRRAGPARVARRRQADPRHARGRRPERRPRRSSGTPRPSTRSTARSARPGRTRCRS